MDTRSCIGDSRFWHEVDVEKLHEKDDGILQLTQIYLRYGNSHLIGVRGGSVLEVGNYIQLQKQRHSSLIEI